MIYIENIGEKIAEILAQNSLTPDVTWEKYSENDDKNYYSVFCTDSDSARYFLKVLITKNDSYKRAIDKEIEFTKRAERYPFKSFTIPNIIKSESGEFYWYLRKNYDGILLGDHSAINEAFSRDLAKYVGEAADAILEINRLDPEVFNGDYLKPYPLAKYKKSIEINGEIIEKQIPGYTKDALALFEKTSKHLYDKKIFCHGDSHLGNFIFDGKAPLVLDWAGVFLGNHANDFVKLWLSFWQFPEAQNFLTEKFQNSLTPDEQDNFDKNLEAMMVYHGASKMRWAVRMQQDKKLLEQYGEKLALEAQDYFLKNFYPMIIEQKLTLIRR